MSSLRWLARIVPTRTGRPGRVRRFRVIDSPIGLLTLTWDPDRDAVVGLHVHDQRDRAHDAAFGEPDDGTCSALDDLAGELGEYFTGDRRRFTLPVDPPG